MKEITLNSKINITYVALLRGINVGGNNKISMPELKSAFENKGFKNVITYINSGNVIFDSYFDEITVKTVCEESITESFGLKIVVGIITAAELGDALAHVPDWWNKASDTKHSDAKHNAIFVIPPLTAQEACDEMGEIKPEYEKVAFYGKVIFWTAPLATFNHTRWSQIATNKKVYNAITIRNANTILKLAELAKQREYI